MELIQEKHEVKNGKISVGHYFSPGSIFTIPSYQRGYKWGVKKDGKCAVGNFCDSLIDAFKKQLPEYFIEAVTVVRFNERYILVDGQQRTTTLLLLFCALEDYEHLKSINIEYDIRRDSHLFLKALIEQKNFDGESDTQDIFYFKLSLETIRARLSNFESKEKEEFKKYIKQKVKLLRNDIPQDKAVNTFIALNGLKARMLDEELVKSQLLIQASRPLSNHHGLEWKISEDRSRMARNWDKWLYWWNQEKVKQYYQIGNHHPLYFLLATYWNINRTEEEEGQKFSFAGFKKRFVNTHVQAKNHFEGLRKLQKRFEDAYNDYESYNFLGIIIRTSNDWEKALHYFMGEQQKKESYESYAKWSLIGATHLEIVEKGVSKTNNLPRQEKADDAIAMISEKYVYSDENGNRLNDRSDLAFRFLLLLNVLEDRKLQRKFDFSIWAKKSLEHIHPQSKENSCVFDPEAQESIHCMGNLVLLYVGNNSAFGNKDFEQKKQLYFNIDNKESFKSRNLLHTLSVFSSSEWNAHTIAENKSSIINRLKNYYGTV